MPKRRKRRSDEAFQMAPMIDMVFLLLVFFMTVSTLAKDARPELDLAVSTTARVPETTPPRDIVTIRGEGDKLHYYWGNAPVSLKQLTKLLDKTEGDSGELLFRAGPELSWETTQEVMQACREVGISEIVFATFED